jgi:hypothetical protein
VTFAATYLDETETAVPISLMFARACPQVAVAAYASRCFAYASVSALVVTVTTWDASGSAADCKFLVEAG